MRLDAQIWSGPEGSSHKGCSGRRGLRVTFCQDGSTVFCWRCRRNWDASAVHRSPVVVVATEVRWRCPLTAILLTLVKPVAITVTWISPSRASSTTAPTDVGFRINHVVDHFRGGHVLEGHVTSTADVDHAALGPVDALGFQQRAADGSLRCLKGLERPIRCRYRAVPFRLRIPSEHQRSRR